jgi:hypothetical protein
MSASTKSWLAGCRTLDNCAGFAVYLDHPSDGIGRVGEVLARELVGHHGLKRRTAFIGHSIERPAGHHDGAGQPEDLRGSSLTHARLRPMSQWGVGPSFRLCAEDREHRETACNFACSNWSRAQYLNIFRFSNLQFG